MSVALLDVNVLVGFLWPPHTHHQLAVDWFKRTTRNSGWATCPITELGCVRVLAGRAVAPANISVTSAAAMLNEFTGDDRHEFWPDDLAWSHPFITNSLPHIQGPRQLTDRYLLALAAAHGGTLATFDRAVAAGLPADSPLLAHLEVIED